LKIIRLAKVLGLLIMYGKSSALIIQKNGLGFILGGFFHKHIWSPCPHPYDANETDYVFPLFSEKAGWESWARAGYQTTIS
jgi:hypothetical protein